ncbi:MAG: lysophospholipid acyltransferase family protein [Candidatus Kapabacteria bacterium]|nr:lysophospholipid acyltransferase family protein [Candidatus Kapabacteria bacterium]
MASYERAVYGLLTLDKRARNVPRLVLNVVKLDRAQLNDAVLMTRSDLATRIGLSEANPVVRIVESILRLEALNGIYSACDRENVDAFLESFFSVMRINRHVEESDLEHIPLHGPVVIVANHPFGAVDGMAMLASVRKRRPDACVMANDLLRIVRPLEDVIIPVDPIGFETSAKVNTGGIRRCLQHLAENKALIVFPAGEVSSPQHMSDEPIDKQWNSTIAKLITRTDATVVPAFIAGRNSDLFYTLGRIHPRLRTAWLPRELLAKRGSSLKLHFGRPIDKVIIRNCRDAVSLAAYLRAHVYALGSLQSEPSRERTRIHSNSVQIAESLGSQPIAQEILQLSDRRILSQGGFELYLIRGDASPNILHEIGRLREVTFRSVGEGTNTALDIDEFDRVYEHLILWHPETSMIAGAYRLGHGGQCIDRAGVSGLYISTLFRIDDSAKQQLRMSLELGRSFVRAEFQRHRLPLFLLWRGILTYLIQHPEIRHIIGPVSISACYTTLSQQLMIDFFASESGATSFSGRVQARTPFKQASHHASDISALLAPCCSDVRILERVISHFETERKGVPVLLRKYWAQSARIVAFNVDPMFSDALDGFMVLNIEEMRSELEEMMNCRISAPVPAETQTL